MSDDNGEPDYSLVMPFVSVTSKGGPYDDEAFTAGWACGQFDERLRITAGIQGVDEMTVTIEASCQEQADLIAMHYGWVTEMVPFDDPDDPESPAAWMRLRCRRAQDVTT